jgi:hypothetical protein
VLTDPKTDLKAAAATLAALPAVVAGDPAGEMVATTTSPKEADHGSHEGNTSRH